MSRTAIVAAVAAVIATGGIANGNAQSDEASTPATAVPRKAFFVGIGGSANSVNFINQNIYAQGVSNVFQNGTQVAFGQAGGQTYPSMDSQLRYAPTVQAGYMEHFQETNWLWGAKFSYAYLGATSTKQNVLVPQAGAFTTTTPTSFTGNVFIRSYETSVNHQMVLMPFIGHSFERNFVYAGVGPTLAQTQTSLKGVIGFADINGTHSDITGGATSFSSSQWVFGGAGTVGMSWFLDKSWFIDLNYSASFMQNPANSFAGPFVGSSGGFVTTGILSGNYSGNVLTHSLGFSINRAF